MKTITLTLVLDEQHESDLWEVLTEGNEAWADGMVRIKTVNKVTRKNMKLRSDGAYERIGSLLE